MRNARRKPSASAADSAAKAGLLVVLTRPMLARTVDRRRGT
jgi:hypothetical protein